VAGIDFHCRVGHTKEKQQTLVKIMGEVRSKHLESCRRKRGCYMLGRYGGESGIGQPEGDKNGIARDPMNVGDEDRLNRATKGGTNKGKGHLSYQRGEEVTGWYEGCGLIIDTLLCEGVAKRAGGNFGVNFFQGGQQAKGTPIREGQV